MNDLSILEIPKIVAKSNENLKWFIENHKILINKFPNKFVAIDDEKVIESNSDIHELLKKIKENENYSISTLIEFINDRNIKLLI